MSEGAKSIEQVSKEGVAALFDRLGAADALRFLQEANRDRGDYTRDRRERSDGPTLDQIIAEIRQMKTSDAERRRSS